MIIIKNRINKRAREIRNFIHFLNKNYEIKHTINFHVVNFPCVYDHENNPALGLFYIKNNPIIEICNDLEWYGKINNIKFNKKFCIYVTLTLIAHEFYHYIQYSNKKKITEHWVNHNAYKIIKKYVNSEYKTILNNGYLNNTSNMSINVLDPVKFFRKKAKL